MCSGGYSCLVAMLISTIFKHQSVTTLSKHIAQHCRELYYHTHLPDSTVTFFSRCVLSVLSSAKNLLADSVIQATYCLLRFPRKIGFVNNKSFRSNLYQNPGQYQNLDFVQRENIPTKFIPSFDIIVVSREVQEKLEKGTVIIPEVCSVVLKKSSAEISEVHFSNFRNVQKILNKYALIFYLRRGQR